MSAKRSHGEGSITQDANGNWRGRIRVGEGRLSFTAATRKEVVDWLRKIGGQVDKGLTYDSAKVTVADYLENWLIGIQGSIRLQTFKAYSHAVNKYLIPYFGDKRIKDLKADHVQAVYDEWVKAGVGIPMVRKCHEVFHLALERGKRTGLVFQNVTELVDRPREQREEMQFWNEGEANRFLTAARENRLYALFHLAIVTGARQMELLGLQWPDLEWVNGTLHFRRQLSRMGTRYSPIKTRAGNRTIKPGAATMAVLKDHYERQQLERALAGSLWDNPDELIFTSRIGTPLSPRNMLMRDFVPLMRLAGVKRIRFHDLRHTAVAIMLSNGKSVFAVSKFIGHARPSITSDIYGHLIPGAADDIGQMMDDLVSPLPLDLNSNEPQNESGTNKDGPMMGLEINGKNGELVKMGEKPIKKTRKEG